MQAKRKKILLVWWYDRKDLIAPFLQMQDELDITVLFYRFKEQENAEVAESLPFKRIYWTDYLSPYQILKEIQPTKVVVFGLEGLTTLSLLMAAKASKIQTFYLSHGLTLSLKERVDSFNNAITEQVHDRYKKNNPIYQKKKWHTLVFALLAACSIDFRALKIALQFIYLLKKGVNPFNILNTLPNSYYIPDKFILYSPYQSLFFKELFHLKSEPFIYVGPYLMDSIFKSYAEINHVEIENYWLFIDQPLGSVPVKKKDELIQRLVKIATKQNIKLVVKLHPMDYSKEVQNSAHLIWIKDHDNLAELVMKSEICFGFNSALLLAIIPRKTTVLFKAPGLGLIDDWGKSGAVNVLEMESFKEEELIKAMIKIPAENKKAFIVDNLSFIDGTGSERLKNVFLM